MTGKEKILARLGSPSGCYIYAWLDKDEVFYIGYGSDKRGLAIHTIVEGTELARCEKRRQSIGDDFKCVVIKDGLVRSLAHAVEKELIQLCNPECNQWRELERASVKRGYTHTRKGLHKEEMKKKYLKGAKMLTDFNRRKALFN